MSKVSIIIIDCPKCEEKLPAFDYEDSKLYLLECDSCKEEFEVRELLESLDMIIKPKKVS